MDVRCAQVNRRTGTDRPELSHSLPHRVSVTRRPDRGARPGDQETRGEIMRKNPDTNLAPHLPTRAGLAWLRSRNLPSRERSDVNCLE